MGDYITEYYIVFLIILKNYFDTIDKSAECNSSDILKNSQNGHLVCCWTLFGIKKWQNILKFWLKEVEYCYIFFTSEKITKATFPVKNFSTKRNLFTKMSAKKRDLAHMYCLRLKVDFSASFSKLVKFENSNFKPFLIILKYRNFFVCFF